MTETDAQLRAQIVDQARWGIAHQPAIHYAEIRPIPLEQYKHHQLPLTTDCSGWVTCCNYAAGAPDPNGLGYNGAGFTGTLLDHLETINLRDAKVADLVVFGAHPGNHVVIILEGAGESNPLVGSHGNEAGPVAISLQAEARGFPGQPITVLRNLTGGAPVPRRRRWVVHDGRGTILAHGRTKRAADRRVMLYAIRNRARWRATRTVIYHRRGIA